MERVVTINLNGNSYQLEEPAYDALRAYLGRAESALAANPDRAEIIRDLEQAIADKCASYLSPHKSVVSAAEMARVLEQMGPVEGETEQTQAGASRDEYVRPDRRLYRIYDRSAWTGVSAGLAAYTGIDVAWVRVLWVVTALFTGGFTILLYLIMIFAVPVASTSEELAAAHGAPFNAQEVVDRAKREYARFSDDAARTWRREHRAWRRQWRAHERSWDFGFGGGAPAPAQPAHPVGYATRMFAGLFAFIFSIITAALLIAFLLALFALLGAGSMFGWTPDLDIPIWMAIIVLCIAYAAISSPFSAMRRSSYATLSGHQNARGGGAADGLITLAIVGVSIWFAWMFWPDAREFIEAAYVALRDVTTHWDTFWLAN